MRLSDGFYSALAARESCGNPRCVNEFGFMGLYQMGKPALQDAGYVTGGGQWTGKNGIRSQDDFLNNPNVQTLAIREYHDKLWTYIPEDVRGSVGRRIGGVEVTTSGLVAAGHLVGHGGITRFIRSNGADDPTDEIDTPCSEYLRQFGGY